MSSWGAGPLFNILQSPHRQRISLPPCSAAKPRLLFKTGCLSEASFPSNKQSRKPDFRRQSGSTRVTLFPHPISWSIGAPEGTWAARHWKPEAMCQTSGGDAIAQGFSVTELGFTPSLYHTIEKQDSTHQKTHRRLNYKRGNSGV